MSEEMDGAPSVAVATEMKIQAEPVGHVSAELADVLGPPRLLKGEDEKGHTYLADQIRLAVAPKTIIEEILARDIADLTWEVLRLRKLKAELVSLRWHGTIWDLAERKLGQTKASALGKAWNQDGHPGQLKSALLEHGVDDDTINAEVLAQNIGEIERFDRLIASAEGRRNALLREIDRHRDAVQMRRLREAVTSIEDAEFEDVTTPIADAAE